VPSRRPTTHLEIYPMRSLTLAGAAILAGALMAGCNAETEPTAENVATLTADQKFADHTVTVLPFEDIIPNPCNGEDVHFIGTITQQATRVGPGDGFTHVDINEVFSVTGTGLTTGLTYTSQGTYHLSFQSPTPEAFQVAFTERQTFFFRTATPGLSFKGTGAFHLVDLPDGEVEKVTTEFDRLECRS
jgi:hypothetical protein